MGGSLTDEEIIKLLENPLYKNIKNFVETGTYKADTTILASKHFNNVFTTEIHQGLYEESKNRVKSMGIKNIMFFLGDSLELLPSIVNMISQTESGSVFFLDAHISGNDSGWNQKICVPLLEELEVILSGPILKNSVFILDDLRFWKDIKPWDWEHISSQKILDLFKKYNYEVLSSYEENDRFYILI